MPELLNDGHPFLRAHVAALGLPVKALQGTDLEHPVRRVFRGCYVDARVQDDLSVRAQAAALVLPPDAVLTGVAAAWLHGVPPLQPRLRGVPPELVALRPRGRPLPRRQGMQGATALVHGDEVVDVGGVLALAPARVAVDLARELERPDALAYLDALSRRHALTGEQLAVVLDRQRGARWVEQARELVAITDPRAESPGESWLRLRWYDAGLPRLDLQVPLCRDGREVFRLDCGLEHLRYAPEYDGEETHGPDRETHDPERRTRALREFGWFVRPFRAGDVLGRGYVFEQTVALDTGFVPELVPWQERARTYLRRRRDREAWFASSTPVA